jgi:hypothetical protein
LEVGVKIGRKVDLGAKVGAEAGAGVIWSKNDV